MQASHAEPWKHPAGDIPGADDILIDMKEDLTIILQRPEITVEGPARNASTHTAPHTRNSGAVAERLQCDEDKLTTTVPHVPQGVWQAPQDRRTAMP